MVYREIDSMLNRGWHLHAINVSNHSLYVFLLQSEHHPSETTYVEDEFITALHDDPSEKYMDKLDRWIENHPLCPLIVNCSTLLSGIYTMEQLLQRAVANKKLPDEIKEWKKFIDKLYYSNN